MPKPIQNPRLGTALQKEFNLVGRVRPILDEVVIPVVTVGDLSADLPAVRRNAISRVGVGAVAGQYAGIRLEVPPGLIAVVTNIYRAGGSSTTRVGVQQSELTTPGNTAGETFLDGRLVAEGQFPACAVTYDTQIAAITANPVTFLSGRQETRIVIAGLNGAYGFLELQDTSVNTAMTFQIEWTEYLPY